MILLFDFCNYKLLNIPSLFRTENVLAIKICYNFKIVSREYYRAFISYVEA